MNSDLENMLDSLHSGEAVAQFGQSASQNPVLFQQLWQATFADNYKTAWHAAWVLDKATEHNVHLLLPYAKDIHLRLLTETNDSVIRHLLKFLLRIPIDLEKAIPLLERFNMWVFSENESMSKRGLPVQYMINIMRVEPAFAYEFSGVFSELWRRGGTPGFMQYLKRAIAEAEKLKG